MAGDDDVSTSLPPRSLSGAPRTPLDGESAKVSSHGRGAEKGADSDGADLRKAHRRSCW